MMSPITGTLLFLLLAFSRAAHVEGARGAPVRPAIRVGDACTTWYDALEPTRTSNATYRNVRWYGAKGDGVTDDTAAFTTALTYARSPVFSLKTPMVVYVPPGDYVITATLPLWFLTHLVGNSKCPPTLILPPRTFVGGQTFVLSGDTSYDGEHDDEFYRGIRHIDISIGAGNTGGAGVHWAVSQATFLRDMVIDLGPDGKFGVFDENGSGGFGSDLTIIGGQTGLTVGNQQWTWLNVNISGQSIACINQIWNWVSAYQGLALADCPVGVQFAGNADGSFLLLDSSATNVPLVFQTAANKNIFLERFIADNVTTIVSTGLPGAPGGRVSVPGWRQGPLYSGGGTLNPAATGAVPLTRADAPLERRARPTFDGDATAPVNVLSYGAVGDGVADDTAALRRALASSPTVFLPYGAYKISSTIVMPAGGALVGELGSILLADSAAPAFASAANPTPLLSVPAGALGVRLVDLLFSMTAADAPGLVFLDWQATADAPGGLWDVSWRVYNIASDLFRVSGDGAGVYWEEGWGWVADHDVDTGLPLTVENPRGMTITATGPSFLYGTAMEHSVLYQYNFSGAAGGITTVVTQTESEYFSVPPTGWAMVMENSIVQMYGSGWYNWFGGNQTALWISTNTTGNAFCINVHGTNAVVVGDVTIAAYTPVEEEWFCDGFTAMLGKL